MSPSPSQTQSPPGLITPHPVPQWGDFSAPLRLLLPLRSMWLLGCVLLMGAEWQSQPLTPGHSLLLHGQEGMFAAFECCKAATAGKEPNRKGNSHTKGVIEGKYEINNYITFLCMWERIHACFHSVVSGKATLVFFAHWSTLPHDAPAMPWPCPVHLKQSSGSGDMDPCVTHPSYFLGWEHLGKIQQENASDV